MDLDLGREIRLRCIDRFPMTLYLGLCFQILFINEVYFQFGKMWSIITTCVDRHQIIFPLFMNQTLLGGCYFWYRNCYFCFFLSITLRITSNTSLFPDSYDMANTTYHSLSPCEILAVGQNISCFN